MLAALIVLAFAVLLLALLLAGAVALWSIASDSAERLRDDLQRERRQAAYATETCDLSEDAVA